MSPGPQVLSRQAALSPEPAAGAGLDRLLLARALPPQPGVWDELREPDGALRTRWRRVAACMPAARAAGGGSPRDAAVDPAADLDRRVGDVAAELRRAGVTHNVFGAGGVASRPWSLELLPL
ncbi:MAG: hypothetical protein ACK537_00460, partial [Pseudomonadota bacterium]